ncbi:conserved hypothetical protein [Perkinsus marinus ATCC 50983]|uniref:ATP-dependent DNA helicase n=1 Tax=Perkinsus marinus (strain ATCC 50983 / TXsc) TaxID=423536 RepID=C5LKS7_PERM5|nr:conserved hypothetical protein [Perkinsus marinus ATCC 50983]EER02681.1 conserved hypothetical protein [Perkinsus marinus ATCC 50983]|eukprot:XP_002769986.1 conserved hypothetical protein [Perkinsus marinus ATCC 50983]
MSSHDFELDIDQKDVLVGVLESILLLQSEPHYHYITGFAGTGKTHVAKAIIANARDCKKCPIVLSWNGMAARVLGGDTFMSYFRLEYERSGKVGDNAFMRCPRELATRILGNLSAAKRRELLSDEAFLIVDEVGIVHDTILDGLSQALKTLRKGKLHGDRPFGGIVTVLIGDPCQLGTTGLFEGSSDFPPQEFPTAPFWKSTVWQEMNPEIAYLTKFHRGESDDDYLQLLSEIRCAEEIIPGVPQFSQKALQVLQDIRDRDAGSNPPRFNHTIICLTNAEADKYNETHLDTLLGGAYNFKSIDHFSQQAANVKDIDMQAIAKMGYRPVVKLKKGCKVMATVNDPMKRFVNGLTGQVVGVRDAAGSEPVVVVKFDGNTNEVEPKAVPINDKLCPNMP